MQEKRRNVSHVLIREKNSFMLFLFLLLSLVFNRDAPDSRVYIISWFSRLLCAALTEKSCTNLISTRLLEVEEWDGAVKTETCYNYWNEAVKCVLLLRKFLLCRWNFLTEGWSRILCSCSFPCTTWKLESEANKIRHQQMKKIKRDEKGKLWKLWCEFLLIFPLPWNPINPSTS